MYPYLEVGGFDVEPGGEREPLVQDAEHGADSSVSRSWQAHATAKTL